MILLFLYECSLSSVDNQRWWDTQTLLAVKKDLNFLHSHVAGMKKLQPQALMPGHEPSSLHPSVHAQRATLWNFHYLIFSSHNTLREHFINSGNSQYIQLRIIMSRNPNYSKISVGMLVIFLDIFGYIRPIVRLPTGLRSPQVNKFEHYQGGPM